MLRRLSLRDVAIVRELDLELGHDDEVAQRQAPQHQTTPSYQRSLRRSVA